MIERNKKIAISTAFPLLMLFMFSGSQAAMVVGGAGAAIAPFNTQTAITPSATPVATVNAIPSTAATVKPTPTAAPTPTPHPWQEHFTDQGAYVSVQSADEGPWVYKDRTLSVSIEKKKNKKKQVYFVAEVYTLDPLPFGGFANKNPKARSRLRPYLIARQYQAVLGITGDYITYKENDKGVMIRNGTLFYERKQVETLAVMPDGELRIFSPGEITAKELLKAGVQDTFAFGPVLVRDGKINEKASRHKLRYRNYRSTIGMVEKGHYIFIVTEGRFEFGELAKIYYDLGCTVAYNLDGGNSTAMVFMGEQLNLHVYNEDLKLGQRPLPDLLMIGSSADVPGEKEPVYNNGERKNKKYKPKLAESPPVARVVPMNLGNH